MSSMPVRLAASISMTSTWRSSAMARQCSHTPHGSAVGPPLPSVPTQLKQRARMRAVVVLPTPRTPVSMKPWAKRPCAIALRKVRTKASCPIRPEKSRGRYLRARTRYGSAGPRCLPSAAPAEEARSSGPSCIWSLISARRKTILVPARGRVRKVGGWTTTRAKTRYGCFLPDLTGLARRPSAANLPPQYMGQKADRCNWIRAPKSPMKSRYPQQFLADDGAVLGLHLRGHQDTGFVVPGLAPELAREDEMPRRNRA